MEFDSIDAFYAFALEHFPEAEVLEDNDGQFVIYTNLGVDLANGKVRSITDMDLDVILGM